jgi:UDP-N-acetylmuramate dehydrogenase
MADYGRRRTEKQPLDMPSAGSTFKRPQGAYAGALIEQCGLRGCAIGGAQISEKHCGFIVNTGNATCADVLSLAETVCKIVTEQTGFALEKEIRVVR